MPNRSLQLQRHLGEKNYAFEFIDERLIQVSVSYYKISNSNILDSQGFAPVSQICCGYDYQTYCVIKS